ncbi:hypothetical protein RRG08_028848 [Elysia crispata]|uniref:Uncharacterized protein n=1 Tax=Elysia crispata TaxID=231223 RepID=A0AAE0Z060_9GAST|nr:hypothetical protein RRG08_028848 [Elysia crispata]
MIVRDVCGFTGFIVFIELGHGALMFPQKAMMGQNESAVTGYPTPGRTQTSHLNELARDGCCCVPVVLTSACASTHSHTATTTTERLLRSSLVDILPIQCALPAGLCQQWMYGGPETLRPMGAVTSAARPVPSSPTRCPGILDREKTLKILCCDIMYVNCERPQMLLRSHALLNTRSPEFRFSGPNLSRQRCGDLLRLVHLARGEFPPLVFPGVRETLSSPGLNLAGGGNVERTLSEIGPAMDSQHISAADLLKLFASADPSCARSLT